LTIESIRLPRIVEADPRAEALRRALIGRSHPVRTGSDVRVVPARFEGLGDVLRRIHQARRVVRGLETVERTLVAEERGMRMADARSEQARGTRVSRLLLLADDGSDGFYRKVETLLRRHGARVLAVRLDVDGAGLGEPVFGAGRPARLLMVQHKEAVAELLFCLAAQFGIE